MTASLSTPSSTEVEISSNSKRNAMIQLSLIIVVTGMMNEIGFGGFYATVVAVALILLFNKVENKSFQSLGFEHQRNWKKLIPLALAAAVIITLLGVVILVVAYVLGLEQRETSSLGFIEGNLGMFLVYLVLSWSIAAFGEEIIWRGFFMTKVAHLFNNSEPGWRVAMVLSGLIFGFLHLYQGWAGAIQVALVSMMFASIFIRSKQNLWLCILTHGFIDTIGFILLYLGLV